jgi:hypothetical protein
MSSTQSISNGTTTASETLTMEISHKVMSHGDNNYPRGFRTACYQYNASLSLPRTPPRFIAYSPHNQEYHESNRIVFDTTPNMLKCVLCTYGIDVDSVSGYLSPLTACTSTSTTRPTVYPHDSPHPIFHCRNPRKLIPGAGFTHGYVAWR